MSLNNAALAFDFAAAEIREAATFFALQTLYATYEDFFFDNIRVYNSRKGKHRCNVRIQPHT